MTSPIDHYYEVLDYINDLECYQCGAKGSPITSQHRISKHLHELLLLTKQAEREYWESINVRLDEE